VDRLRALIVDDEPLARERVRRLLEADGGVDIVGECRDGFAAVERIDALAPDLVFLDVMMPGKDGFAVLEELRGPPPAVIFLTAYDRYALRAFEACALDYLLKPFDEDRFARALARARRALAERGPPAALPLAAAAGPLRRLVVKEHGRIFLVRTADVAYVAAEGNYARVRAGGRDHLVRAPLASLEAQLDAAVFVRIHRSTLVNLERVRQLEPLFHGQYAVILEDGTRLTLSRRYRAHLERALGRPLGG
jgi:two-component system LytT family response regulator